MTQNEIQKLISQKKSNNTKEEDAIDGEESSEAEAVEK